MLALTFLCCSTASAEDKVPLSAKGDNNPPASGQPIPRTPAFIPNACIDGYTLTFDASCIGCAITLIQDDTVVYSTVISENTDGDGEVILPDYLVGQYEIQIEYGSIILVGNIEL